MGKLEKLFFNWFFKSRLTIYNHIDEYKSRSILERFSSKWWSEVIIKLIMLLIIIISSLLLFGCTAKTITEYKTVQVPVKCKIDIPSKPKSTGDILKDNILILKYSDELFIALKKCK